jgi:hypothetical protein
MHCLRVCDGAWVLPILFFFFLEGKNLVERHSLSSIILFSNTNHAHQGKTGVGYPKKGSSQVESTVWALNTVL